MKIVLPAEIENKFSKRKKKGKGKNVAGTGLESDKDKVWQLKP